MIEALERLWASANELERADLVRTIIEHAGLTVRDIVRVYFEPEEVIVLYVNPHGEARTAWLLREDDAVMVRSVQGFA